MTQNSLTLSIISVYLKGQKTLYIDAKTHCEQKLNLLMLPAILISAICTILSMGLKTWDYGALLVSSLTGINSFILAIISYLKLDAKAEAHKTSSYQFDKLQTMCEFFSGKVLLVKDDEMVKKVTQFIDDVEKKIEDIKDANQFIIPEAIRYRYNTIYSTNVFSEIKKIKKKEKVLRHELNVLSNKINTAIIPNQALIVERESKLIDVLKYRNEYYLLDETFNKEIRCYYKSSRRRCSICNWLKT
jgi:hypothetical protein